MKPNYKIISINSEVIAREVNPYGEKPEVKYDGTFEDMVMSTHLTKWQEAEKNLKEYPISKISYSKLYLNATKGEFLIGQIIQAELINGELYI